MKILLDTNVILDVVEKREPFFITPQISWKDIILEADDISVGGVINAQAIFILYKP